MGKAGMEKHPTRILVSVVEGTPSEVKFYWKTAPDSHPGPAANRPHHWLIEFSSVSQSCPTLCNPWIAARQASLSITNSRSSLKLTSIELVMPSSHLILCRPLLLLPSIPPSIRVFSNESTLCMRWPKYWSFSFSISPSNKHPGLISTFKLYCQ